MKGKMNLPLKEFLTLVGPAQVLHIIEEGETEPAFKDRSVKITRTEHQRRKGSQVFRKENLRRKERPFRKSDRNTDTQRGRCERNL